MIQGLKEMLHGIVHEQGKGHLGYRGRYCSRTGRAGNILQIFQTLYKLNLCFSMGITTLLIQRYGFCFMYSVLRTC